MTWLRLAFSMMVLAGCSDDEGDDDDVLGGDGDADADGDADPPPQCVWETGGVSIEPRVDEASGIERRMRVASVTDDSMVVEDDAFCDPNDEVWVRASFPPPPSPSIRLPALGAEVDATIWEFWDGAYARFRDVEGTLLWEGGQVTADPAMGSPFRVLAMPDADVCSPNPLPADDTCCCELWAPLRATVETDDGPIEMGSWEFRDVLIGGLPYVAVVTNAIDIRDMPCIDDGITGPMLHAYLAATFDGAFGAEPPYVEPADDECPAAGVEEWGGCTTLYDRQCDYDLDGCVTSYACRGCFWHEVARGPLELCPGDEMSCQDEGCPEELVCSDCSCPDPIGERWRCVGPEQPCPPCE